MSNKKFGYARVSTAEQNEDRQVLELLEYGIEERDIYVDKQSGRSFERTNYMSLRNSILRNGDILVVKSIDRFGRSYSGIRAEFLNYVRNSEYIFTDSFHCSVFSILYKKNFFVFSRFSENAMQNTNTRIDNLLSLTNLSQRKIDTKKNIDNLLSMPLDYVDVDERLEILRKSSLAYLEQIGRASCRERV